MIRYCHKLSHLFWVQSQYFSGISIVNYVRFCWQYLAASTTGWIKKAWRPVARKFEWRQEPGTYISPWNSFLSFQLVHSRFYCLIYWLMSLISQLSFFSTQLTTFCIIFLGILNPECAFLQWLPHCNSSLIFLLLRLTLYEKI